MDNFTIHPVTEDDVINTHDYRGFTIEKIFGGFSIIAHCHKHTFYFSGPRGFELSINKERLKTFRTVFYCHKIIDELFRDHEDWIKSLSQKKAKVEK